MNRKQRRDAARSIVRDVKRTTGVKLDEGIFRDFFDELEAARVESGLSEGEAAELLEKLDIGALVSGTSEEAK
jgi:hypothetical protein